MAEQFWNVVEKGDREVTVQYGSDIDTRVTGSGFSRQPQMGQRQVGVCLIGLTNLRLFLCSSWNLNNFPKMKGSVLRHFDTISGVSAPWLYVGMMFSAFCWHNEDHYFSR